MPVSVNSALRDSLGSVEHHHPHQLLQSQIASATKHLVLKKIEYEKYPEDFLAQNDSLKSKYIFLSSNNAEKKSLGTHASQNGTNGLDSSHGNGGGPDSGHTSTTPKKDNKNELPLPKRVLFPRDKVKVGWKGSDRKWQVGSGFINVGNTCYLNSTLQALLHVPAMANWLAADSEHREQCSNGGEAACTICAVATTLRNSQQAGHAVKPYLVYSRLRSICKHMVVGRQEDAHEFLRYLIESMEKAYLERFPKHVITNLDQYSKETTPLNQILGFYLRSSVRCLSCNHVSNTFQHFEDLLLDIRKSNTVDEALQGFFAREKLEDMDYTCSGCKKKVTATKQFSMERPPVVLCIQLKRFSMQGNKLNKQVSIKPKLDLTPYVRRTGGNHGAQPLTYRLVSMVTHLGSSQHCGHYTAIGLTESGAYYQFDDSSVHPIALQNVLQTNAYIIFYELENAAVHRSMLNANGNGVTSTVTSQSPLKVGAVNGTGVVKQQQNGGGSKLMLNGNGPTNGNFIGPVLPPNHPNKERALTNGYSSPATASTSRDMPLLNGCNGSPAKLNGKLNIDSGAAGSANGVKKYPSAELLFKSPARQQTTTMSETSTAVVNGREKSPGASPIVQQQQQQISPKSLVPYNSNLSSDEDDDSDDEERMKNNRKAGAIVLVTNGKDKEPRVYENGKRVNGGGDGKHQQQDEEAEEGEIGDEEDTVKSSTTTTNGFAPYVNTNSGVWKVCSNAENSEPSSPVKKPGVVFKGLWKGGNNNNQQQHQNGNGSTKVLNELLKQDHNAYGGVAVSTWSGEKSNLDKEISAEKNLKRSSDRKADDDEMDRGHMKKMKLNNKVGRDNPGFNPFQEQENKNNQQQANGNSYRPPFNTNRHQHNNGHHKNGGNGQSRSSWVNNNERSGMGPYNPKFPHHKNNNNRPQNKPWARQHNGNSNNFKKHGGNNNRFKGNFSRNNNHYQNRPNN